MTEEYALFMGRMHRRKWLILAIDAADREGLTPAQLQKSLFVLARDAR
jgi:hypothetical protein